MLVKKEDVKDFSKEKEPLSNFLKGETKTDPILRSGNNKLNQVVDSITKNAL